MVILSFSILEMSLFGFYTFWVALSVISVRLHVSSSGQNKHDGAIRFNPPPPSYVTFVVCAEEDTSKLNLVRRWFIAGCPAISRM